MKLRRKPEKVFMLRSLVFCTLALALEASAFDDPTVFKSEVAMTRVDAQVVDRSGRAVTGLRVEDFVLRLNGHVLPIRNFASENMPIDILLLLDVSGSMEPHVQRIASAAQQALNVLADKDRVAIMVFDTSARVRLPFRSNHGEVTSELNHLLRAESFRRGTRITSAMLEAADYVKREARPDARRAIVILTDDQTQDGENESRVEAALSRADAVLSFLEAPYAVPGMTRGGRPRGPWGSSGGGGGWPGGGGGIGLPGGGIGFPGGGGRRGPYGGVDPSHSAGTAEIARDSGGDTIQVDEASALEDTLAKLRQRYALYFYIPEGAKSADDPVRVDLAQEARIRFSDAEIHYRRVFMSGGNAGAPVVTKVQRSTGSDDEPTVVQSTPSSTDDSAPRRRRVAVNEDSGPDVNMSPSVSSDPGAGTSSNTAAPKTAQPPPQSTQQGGWPSAKLQ